MTRLRYAIAATAVLALVPAGALAEWTPPVDISIDSTPQVYGGPAIGAGPTGQATVVWTGLDAFTDEKQDFAVSGFGAQWATPFALGPVYTRPPCGSSSVAYDDTGAATVAWSQVRSGLCTVLSRTSSGSGWGPEQTIFDDADGTSPDLDAQDVSLGVDASGVMSAAFSVYDNDSGRTSVYVARRAPGGAWGTAEQVSDPNAVDGDSDPPVITVSSAGDTLVAWYGQDVNTSDRVVQVRRRTAAGTWDPVPTTLASGPDLAGNVGMAGSAQGDAVVIWRESVSGDYILQSKRFRPAAGWDAAPTTLAGPPYPNTPAVAMSADGRAAVAWQDYAASPREILVTLSSTDGTWDAAPTRVSDPAAGRATDPVIASDAVGNVTVAWKREGVGGAPNSITTRHYSVSTGWEPEPVVVSDPVFTAFDPAIAADAAGAVTVAWTSKDLITEQNDVVSASRLAPPAAPTGASAVAGDGRATVSWTAPRADGGAPVTSYAVTASPGGATCTAAAPATSCAVAGLTNGTAYTFTVKASNRIGVSPPSAPSAPVTPSGAAPSPVVPAKKNLKVSITCVRGVCTTTGVLPPGATRATQFAVTGSRPTGRASEMARTRRVQGRCTVRAVGAKRTFRCRVKLSTGRWWVSTRAWKDTTVVSGSVRRVRIPVAPRVTG